MPARAIEVTIDALDQDLYARRRGSPFTKVAFERSGSRDQYGIGRLGSRWLVTDGSV
jgi:hypothetical protein